MSSPDYQKHKQILLCSSPTRCRPKKPFWAGLPTLKMTKNRRADPTKAKNTSADPKSPLWRAADPMKFSDPRAAPTSEMPTPNKSYASFQMTHGRGFWKTRENLWFFRKICFMIDDSAAVVVFWVSVTSFPLLGSPFCRRPAWNTVLSLPTCHLRLFFSSFIKFWRSFQECIHALWSVVC